MVAACWESVKGDHSSVECVWISGKDTVPPPLSSAPPPHSLTHALMGSLTVPNPAPPLLTQMTWEAHWTWQSQQRSSLQLWLTSECWTVDLQQLQTRITAASLLHRCPHLQTGRSVSVEKNHSLILVFHYRSQSQRFIIVFGPFYSPTRSMEFLTAKKNPETNSFKCHFFILNSTKEMLITRL